MNYLFLIKKINDFNCLLNNVCIMKKYFLISKMLVYLNVSVLQSSLVIIKFEFLMHMKQ
jgi:hypothetical protein